MFLSRIELCLSLDISVYSCDTDIESRYKCIVMEVHPDRGGSSELFMKYRQLYADWKNGSGFYSKPYKIVSTRDIVVCRCGDNYNVDINYNGIIHCNSCSCYILYLCDY